MNLIEPETLCEWLTTDTTDSVVIIDVRDEDYPDGGSIRGAQNIPSAQFTDHVQQLAMRYHDKPHRIVFHCMLSQVRGPSCALRFIEELEEMKESAVQVHCQVMVLRGGFKGWRALYKRDKPHLFENI